MNWAQIIAELGGGGAILSLVVNLAQQYRQATLDRMKFDRDNARQDASQEDAQILLKMEKIASSDLGAWVHRLIVIVSMLIISSPIWAPLLAFVPFSEHMVGVVWYWPTEGSFILFEWSKLKELVIGPASADVMIGVLPIHIAMTTNVMGFYFINRIYKRK